MKSDVSPRSSVKPIFVAAQRLTDPNDRRVYLQEACGEDSDLRAKVEGLLAALDQAPSSPLDEAVQMLGPAQTGTLDTAAEESIDVASHPMIGPYKLLERLGEGGMGTVYMAQQKQPVKRQVALKLIKPGMDSQEVIARFEAERQALAMMDHSNIARIFDGGLTEQGRPYFVMELVRGLPIDEYCDEVTMSLRDRLKLFTDVCRAVQHAHQKGIIHRDLKPSNILLTLHDSVPVVKVIDFGIAKALDHELTERTLFTRFAELVGTPVYMSPEQAEMSGLNVDTRSDVYSLGVMLYKLLVGVTPFDESTLKSAGLDEMRRIIREDEPFRPSQRVSTLDNELVSDRRGTDCRKLTLSMQRELDWIVMKALEKDRNRRYESASALAQDIQRYLDDEPVEACPPSTAYRLRKYARRHKRLLTMAGLLAATLLIATGISVSQAWWAMKSEQLAEERLAQSQQSFERAIQSVDQMLARVGDKRLQNVPQMKAVQAELLQDALKFYKTLLEQDPGNPKVRYRMAGAQVSLGSVLALLDQNSDAEAAFHDAIATLDDLVRQSPDELDYQTMLADAHNNLGWLLGGPRIKESEDSHRKAAESYKLLLTEHPDTPHYRWQLAHSYQSIAGDLDAQNLLDEAETFARRAIELFRDFDVDTGNIHAAAYSKLAKILQERGRFEQADTAYASAIRICREYMQEMPPHFGEQHFLAQMLLEHGQLLQQLEQHDQAAQCYKEAADIWQLLEKSYPNASTYGQQFSFALGRLVDLHMSMDRGDAAKQLILDMEPHTAWQYAQRAELYEQLSEFDKAQDDYKKAVGLDLNDARLHFALAYFLNHVRHDGFRDYESALKHAERAVALNPGDVLSLLLAARISHGRFKDATQALIHLDNAARLTPLHHGVFTLRSSINDSKGDYLPALADADKAVQIAPNTWTHLQRGRVYSSLKRFDSALADFKLAEQADPKNTVLYDARAKIYISLGRYKEALVDLDKLLQITPFQSRSYKRRGLVHFHLAQYDQALDDIEKALEVKPTDLSCLSWIDTDLVANCPNEAFRTGMRRLADHAVELNHRSARSLSERAQLLFAFGEWDRAQEDIDAVIATDNASYLPLYQAALLSVARSDTPRYEMLCLKMLDTFGQADVSIETHFTTWTCTLAPDAIGDYAPAIQLARLAVEKNSDSQEYRNGLGAILMRSGRHDEAKVELEKVLGTSDSDVTSQSYARYFVAMSEHHLGHEQAARQQLENAIKSADEELAESPSWNRKLTLELLRKEAGALIGKPDTLSDSKAKSLGERADLSPVAE